MLMSNLLQLIYINKGTSQSVMSGPSVTFHYELVTTESVVTNTLGGIINIQKLPTGPRILGAWATWNSSVSHKPKSYIGDNLVLRIDCWVFWKVKIVNLYGHWFSWNDILLIKFMTHLKIKNNPRNMNDYIIN